MSSQPAASSRSRAAKAHRSALGRGRAFATLMGAAVATICLTLLPPAIASDNAAAGPLPGQPPGLGPLTSQSPSTEPLSTEQSTYELTSEQRAALAAGAELYAANCAVCHGRTGNGLEEARLAFPPDEQRCTRCHRPNNRTQQSLSQPVIDNNMFSVGNPPALFGTAEAPTMATHSSGQALWAYVKATMPRYEPGRHSDSEYWLITAHLLASQGRLLAAAEAIAASMSTPAGANP